LFVQHPRTHDSSEFEIGNSIDRAFTIWDITPVYMLPFTAFAIVFAALLGGVWWVSRDDQGAS
jgi:hypothetical protein